MKKRCKKSLAVALTIVAVFGFFGGGKTAGADKCGAGIWCRGKCF